MPLPLPNFDNRTFADLVEEVRARIPAGDPSWTNHNPSDPGITLVELFAWLAEMLIYRTNRIPDRNLVTFLKLLNPKWTPTPGRDLAEEIRQSLLVLRREKRAVTCKDYEGLAKEASPDVARAKCVPRRYLGAGTEPDRKAPRPGHMSLIIIPQAGSQPSSELIQDVEKDLDPYRVLTTRLHVIGPVYAPVSMEILVARRADAPAEDLRSRIVDELTKFLSPLKGGPDGHGWPFGRDVYVSELYELLERVQGVNYVPDIVLSSQCPPEAMRCVAARELWHEDGDLIGLEIAAHHLPQAEIDPARIVLSVAFVPVQVKIEVNASVGPASVRRAVKAAVKQFVHPLHGGPDGAAERQISLDSIRSLVKGIFGVEGAIRVSLQSDPAHEIRNELGGVTGVFIRKRELADTQVQVEIQ